MDSFYPENIKERLLLPKNAGTVDNASSSGTDATFVCGCFVRFCISIGRDDKKVTAVRYQTNGCGYMIAAADVLAETTAERDLTELHGLESDELIENIENLLGEYPTKRSHCLKTPANALRAAFANYRNRLIEEFRGEKALICTCFGISEDSIEKCIADHQPETAAEVAMLCKAGSGCGSCRMLIQEMIDMARVENI